MSDEKTPMRAPWSDIAPRLTEITDTVLFDDVWQRRGVGSLLVAAVLRRLAETGATAAVGYMQPDNAAVGRLVPKVAPEASFHTEDGVVVVRIPLTGTHAWQG